MHSNTGRRRCDCCNLEFLSKEDIIAHILELSECIRCKQIFRNKEECFNHETKCDGMEGKDILRCKTCLHKYHKRLLFHHQKTRVHRNSLLEKIAGNISVAQTALKNNLRVYKIENVNEEATIQKFFDEIKSSLAHILELEITENDCIKFRCELLGIYYKPNVENEEEDIKHIHSRYTILSRTDIINEVIPHHFDKIITKSQEFEATNGSGWSLQQILHMFLEVFKFTPFKKKGGSYLSLPIKLRNKGIINPRNSNDDYCFLYCILAKMYPIKNERMANRPVYYKEHLKKINIENISFPISLFDIDKFLKINSHLNLSVNVYGYENGSFILLKICKVENFNHVDLLLLESQQRFHYCLIQDFNKAFRVEVTSNTKAIYFCKTCLAHFSSVENLSLHKEIGCGNTKILFKKTEVRFDKYESCYKFKFLIFADFECLLRPLSSCKPNPEKSYTMTYQYHECFVAGFLWNCYVPDKKLKDIRIYTGQQCVKKFILALEKDCFYIYEKYFKIKYPITKFSKKVKDYLLKKQDYKCLACGKDLGDKYDADHDHSLDPNKLAPHADQTEPFYGNFRSYLHGICNRLCREKYVFPLYMHNSKSYDFHILVLQLAKMNRKIKVLPKTSSAYIMLSWRIPLARYVNLEIRCLDSMQFLNSSLGSLVESVRSFPILDEYLNSTYKNIKFDQMIYRKQIMCYEKFASFDTLLETEFPPKHQFYSTLTSKEPNDDEYSYAKMIYQDLNMQNLLEYVLFYTKIDLILLAEIFIGFRNLIFQHYKLDPAHFYGLAGLTYSCSLKFTKMTLQLLPDSNYANFVENSLRGGLVSGNFHYVESNSRWLKNGIDKAKGEERQIVYLDTVSLYSHVMANFPLPFGNYAWLTDDEIFELQSNISKFANDEKTGYLIMCDILYPSSLHDKHKYMPILSEKKVMKDTKFTKLVCTLYDKQKYICHIKMLELACHLGLKIKKIHKVMRFSHSKWLEPYINLNTSLRADSSLPKFYVNIFKSMSNVLYGRFQQKKFKYRDFHLITGDTKKDLKMFFKKTSSARLKNTIIFNENLIGIELSRKSIEFDTPSIISSCILDFAKYFMIHLLYCNLGPILKEPIPIYSDTDAYVLIYNGDIFEIYKKYPNLFDTSKFAKGNKYGVIPQNAMKSGCLKDETNGKIISKFIFLSCKVYVCLLDGEEAQLIKRAKGIKKNVIELLNYKDYENALITKKHRMFEQHRITSKKHEIFTIVENRIGLKVLCDKRYFISDYESLPWGHKDIKHIQPPFDI